MSDDRYREAERTWQATGAPEDAERLDRESRRAGRISQPRRGLILRMAHALRERQLDLLMTRADMELGHPAVHWTYLRRDVEAGLLIMERQLSVLHDHPVLAEEMVVLFAVRRYLRRLEPPPFQRIEPLRFPDPHPVVESLKEQMAEIGRQMQQAIMLPPSFFRDIETGMRQALSKFADADIAMSLAIYQAGRSNDDE